ncbi:unnamed protein product [Arctia plantaginis]|uniref:Uncharacterized protein n=1 Tax=Arctia plantaginis TaxID=874455 RepID=A0A8S0ZMI7_ARCPL|nr:unnamed protein product [Arctia plantaginis]CAB3241435.1 unnamed protein product [Arctia plantaginis]
MFMKKCTVEKVPDPPPPDLCKLQRIRKKQKAGIKICPKPPPPQPEPPPTCFGICIEKVKNPPLPPKTQDFPIVCTVAREITTEDRCDAIKWATAAKPDLPWPSCPPPPPAPEPPKRDPCEELERRKRIARCKERMRRYYD